MRILLIHGRAQEGKDPEKLKAQWVEALKDGLKGINRDLPDDIEIVFPYYGDKLAEMVEQLTSGDDDDLVPMGPGGDVDAEYQAFMSSFLEEIKESSGITDDEVKQEIDAEIIAQGVTDWGWVQGIAKAIDKRLTGVSKFVIRAFLTDAFLYVSKSAPRRIIDRIVYDCLLQHNPNVDPTSIPTLVIGHSLGSVVGYNVLHKNPEIPLVRFLTLGSPLGIKAISSKLGVVSQPGAQQNWFNGFDDRDIVALNPLDQRHFPTPKPIDNDDSLANDPDDSHSIEGYLRTKPVATIIAQALDQMSR